MSLAAIELFYALARLRYAQAFVAEVGPACVDAWAARCRVLAVGLLDTGEPLLLF